MGFNEFWLNFDFCFICLSSIPSAYYANPWSVLIINSTQQLNYMAETVNILTHHVAYVS